MRICIASYWALPSLSEAQYDSFARAMGAAQLGKGGRAEVKCIICV